MRSAGANQEAGEPSPRKDRDMETIEPIIKDHPFFQGLKSDHIKLILGCASNVRFNPGEFLLREGEETHQFFVLRHGKVAVQLYVPGRGPIVIQTLDEGEVLGWSWLISPYQARFDVRAIELTRAIAFDGKCLRGKCEEDHDFGYELMKRFSTIMVKRLEATRVQLLDVYGKDAGKTNPDQR
jgi:CRP/FNR family transcriptional regulator, cyclic AMP receptor protein